MHFQLLQQTKAHSSRSLPETQEDTGEDKQQKNLFTFLDIQTKPAIMYVHVLT